MGFLDRLVSENGLVCITTKGTYTKNYHFKDIKTAMDFAISQDLRGVTVYLAQATFNTNESRKGDNALEIKNFFLDIDCGYGSDGKPKPYLTQKEGADALKKFVSETGLPFPSVVSSGNGLYAHWILDKAIPAQLWKHIAHQFKGVTGQLKFEVDFGLTANSACVLRPPGVHHRKNTVCKLGLDESGVADATLMTQGVVLLKEADDITIEQFTGPVEAMAKQLGVKPPASPRAQDINDEFAVREQQDSDGHRVAEKCAQIGNLKRTRGDVAEPIWYAGIGVLRHCEDSDALIHEWSAGHPAYSVEETDAKIQQHIDSGTGPTTCSFFSSISPTACNGCRFINKIKSPIVLGFPERQAAAPVVLEQPVQSADPLSIPKPADELPPPPEPFMRTKDGLCVTIEDEQYLFYPYDFFPISLQYDEVYGYETVTFRHHLPHEGWKEFTLKSSLVKDPKGFLTALWDNHVKTVGKKGSELMVKYGEGYLQKLQSNRKMAQVFAQMGWKVDPDGSLGFALGGSFFTNDGEHNASLGRNVPEAVKAFHGAGDISEWANLTGVLNDESMRGHAFSLLAGAFGSPLLRFTGYEGAMVAMVGESGNGKSLMGRWILSTYGDPKPLMMFKEDTKNSLVARLGIYGSLPLYIDEVSNYEPMELSDMAYRITQGRDKARLDRNSVERANMNTWNTLAVVSSNHSLLDKLASAKADASAEINRIFEFSIDESPLLTRELGSKIYRTFDDNYGLVGREYIRYLIADQAFHQQRIDALTQQIDTLAGCAPQERFWSAVAAVSIYGGMIAQKLGLIQFEIAPVMDWTIEAIKTMKNSKRELVYDNFSLLGDYLAETQANTLIVNCTKDKSPQADVNVMSFPRGPLSNRYEFDSNVVYLSTASLRHWLNKKSGSFSAMRGDLRKAGALQKVDTRKVLGAGTHLGGTQQYCWKIDLTCPRLGHVAAKLVKAVDSEFAVKGEVK